jgi:hypothetical protein
MNGSPPVMLLLPSRAQHETFVAEALCVLGVNPRSVLYVRQADTVHAVTAVVPETSKCGRYNTRLLRP